MLAAKNGRPPVIHDAGSFTAAFVSSTVIPHTGSVVMTCSFGCAPRSVLRNHRRLLPAELGADTGDGIRRMREVAQHGLRVASVLCCIGFEAFEIHAQGRSAALAHGIRSGPSATVS